MEELQSTEVLDREILEDARKKALRLLKQADDTIKLQNEQWDEKTNKSIDELLIKYNEQKKTETEKVMARLPVDKLRLKIEYMENLLKAAVESWYKSLNQQQILDLLYKELTVKISNCKNFTSAGKINVQICELEQKEVESILNKLDIKNPVFLKNPSLSAARFPFIILETESVRITASIEKAVDYLLLNNRLELINALTDNLSGEDA